MELIRRAAMDAMRSAQLPVEEAMAFQPVRRVREPRTTVALSRCTQEGRYTYLGMYETEGEPLELYAHHVKAELLGVAHTPVGGGATDCAALASRMAGCWLGGIPGLSVQSVTTEAPEYDAALDCFTAAVRAEAAAWVYALPVDDGLYFEDFALKGTLLAWNGQEETR